MFSKSLFFTLLIWNLAVIKNKFDYNITVGYINLNRKTFSLIRPWTNLDILLLLLYNLDFESI